MKANELRKLSEKWGVDLHGFENLVIPLKSENYYNGGSNEVKRISKELERRGYRLCGAHYEWGHIVVYAFDDGTYGFSDTVKYDLSGFKYTNIKDIQGDQVMDKNLFFGFVYGFAFGVFLMLILWWIL